MKIHVWCLLLVPQLLLTSCANKKPENPVVEPEPAETVIENTGADRDQIVSGQERDTYDTDGSSAATAHIKNTYLDEYGNLIYTIVEQKPTFKGGEEMLHAFLKANIRYPREALNKKVSGTVQVAFIIGKDGSIRDVELARGLEDPSLNQEAIRLVSVMPNWVPGMQNGEKVNVKYTLPVTFDYAP